jgi:hypothetical protein
MITEYSDEYMSKAKSFRSFYFSLRFNKNKIALISREGQLARSVDFFSRIGELHPLLKNWYRGGNSPEEGLRFNVVEHPAYLREEADSWLDDSETISARRTKYVLWNGQVDHLNGALTMLYDAHDMTITMPSIEFEDVGFLLLAIPDAREVLIGMMRAAVEVWPEIEWGVIAPLNYYLDFRIFKDRQTVGWIGYCPHKLTKEMLPEAEDLISLPERGTIVVTCPGVMDEKNKEHYERVGDIDTKLVELGYLPMFVS